MRVGMIVRKESKITVKKNINNITADGFWRVDEGPLGYGMNMCVACRTLNEHQVRVCAS